MPDPIRGVNISNPVNPTGPAATGQTNASTSTGAAGSGVATGSGADLADVGQTEALLQSIINAASNVPGVDQTRVAELQQAIASGAYQTNPQAIAQKLVELENLLGTAGQLQ